MQPRVLEKQKHGSLFITSLKAKQLEKAKRLIRTYNKLNLNIIDFIHQSWHGLNYVITELDLESLNFLVYELSELPFVKITISYQYRRLGCIESYKKYISNIGFDKAILNDEYLECLRAYCNNKHHYKPFVEYFRDLGLEIEPLDIMYGYYPSSQYKFLYKTDDELLYPLFKFIKNSHNYLYGCISCNRLDLLQSYGFNPKLKTSSLYVQEAISHILNKNYDIKMLIFLIEQGFSTNIDNLVYCEEGRLIRDPDGKLIEPLIKKSYLFAAIEQGKDKLVRVLLQAGCKIDNDLIRCLPFMKITDEVNAILLDYRDLNSSANVAGTQSCRIM